MASRQLLWKKRHLKPRRTTRPYGARRLSRHGLYRENRNTIRGTPTYFGGVNVVARGLARDGYCRSPRGLCRNSDNQRLRFLDFGSGFHCLAQFSHRQDYPFAHYDTHRATFSCDRGALRRNPNSQRLRLLGFGNRLSQLSCAENQNPRRLDLGINDLHDGTEKSAGNASTSTATMSPASHQIGAVSKSTEITEPNITDESLRPGLLLQGRW